MKFANAICALALALGVSAAPSPLERPIRIDPHRFRDRFRNKTSDFLGGIGVHGVHGRGGQPPWSDGRLQIPPMSKAEIDEDRAARKVRDKAGVGKKARKSGGKLIIVNINTNTTKNDTKIAPRFVSPKMRHGLASNSTGKGKKGPKVKSVSNSTGKKNAIFPPWEGICYSPFGCGSGSGKKTKAVPPFVPICLSPFGCGSRSNSPEDITGKKGNPPSVNFPLRFKRRKGPRIANHREPEEVPDKSCGKCATDEMAHAHARAEKHHEERQRARKQREEEERARKQRQEEERAGKQRAEKQGDTTEGSVAVTIKKSGDKPHKESVSKYLWFGNTKNKHPQHKAPERFDIIDEAGVLHDKFFGGRHRKEGIQATSTDGKDEKHHGVHRNFVDGRKGSDDRHQEHKGLLKDHIHEPNVAHSSNHGSKEYAAKATTVAEFDPTKKNLWRYRDTTVYKMHKDNLYENYQELLRKMGDIHDVSKKINKRSFRYVKGKFYDGSKYVKLLPKSPTKQEQIRAKIDQKRRYREQKIVQMRRIENELRKLEVKEQEAKEKEEFMRKDMGNDERKERVKKMKELRAEGKTLKESEDEKLERAKEVKDLLVEEWNERHYEDNHQRRLEEHEKKIQEEKERQEELAKKIKPLLAEDRKAREKEEQRARKWREEGEKIEEERAEKRRQKRIKKLREKYGRDKPKEWKPKDWKPKDQKPKDQKLKDQKPKEEGDGNGE